MKIYKQTTKFTCGPASILMILNHCFPKKFSLTRKNEIRFWKEAVRSPLRGTSTFALASILKKEGLKPKVYVGRIKYSSLCWKNKKDKITKTDVKVAAEVTEFYYRDALKDGIFIKKTSLKFEDIDKFLPKSDFIILRVNLAILKKGKNNTTHYIVISEKKESKYHVYDPYLGESWLKKDRLKKAFETTESLCGEDRRALLIKR